MNILINSNSRISGTSSNFTVQLPTNILVTKGKQISLQYLQMYNTIYNVDSTNNNVDFVVSAVNYTATLTPGSYSATSFASALQTAMTAQVANTWNVSYSTTTFYF